MFTKDKNFYRTLARLMVMVVLQNVIAYSVNMADNLMLGAYCQDALSGAAAVNMIQFMVQQLTMAIGDSMIVINSQYWGARNTSPIHKFTGLGVLAGLLLGGLVFVLTTSCPYWILGLFTGDEAIIAQGLAYLELIRFTYPIYILTTVLMAALRSVETVGISFAVSLLSLAVDVGINYTLIFGHFGFPEMGIRGAAVGTLTARILELSVILLYLGFRDQKLRLSVSRMFRIRAEYFRDFFKVLCPLFFTQIFWSIATPIQTGILGRLSSDAIAANSVSTTMFQYLKVVTVGEASASAVLMGRTVGSGDMDKIKSYSRTLQVMYLIFGLLLGLGLFLMRKPFLSIYTLTDEARVMADQILILMSFIMVGMAYQMPTGSGIIKGGGDVKFSLVVNLISTWGIVMPLSFLAAFYWKLPVVAVVALLNSDQIFKCIPIAVRANRYRWIHRLAKPSK